MNLESKQRIKYVKILELLKQESDEERPLDTVDIIEKLRCRGVSLDRKILYEDMKILQELGYEIVCKRAKRNQYYIVDRDFDVAELRILIDAVEAASFIGKPKTDELNAKIAALGGSYRGKLLLRPSRYIDTHKHNNPYIFYSVNEVEEAINDNRKVSFKYFDFDFRAKRVYRKDGGEYVVDPIGTVFNNGNYYLVCYSNKYKKFNHYRIDRMEGVRVLEEYRNLSSEVKKLDIAKHKHKSFNMYGGEQENVLLEFDESLINVIFDNFGEDISIVKINDKHMVRVEVYLSPQFYGMILGLGQKIKILSPQNVVDDFCSYVDNIRENYRNND